MTLIKKLPRPFVRKSWIYCAALFVNACSNHSHVYEDNRLSPERLQHVHWLYSKELLDLTDVKSFDVYAEGNILHVAIAGVVDKATPQQVYYLRSDDGGIQWTKPTLIAPQNTPPINSRGNDIQIAAVENQIVVLWQTSGEFPNQGPIVSLYSQDAGNTWNSGAPPAGNAVDDQAHIDLVGDQQRHFHAVWLQDPEEHGYQSVRYARSINGGQTWESAVTLDDSTCSCCWNTLKVSASGKIDLLYRDMEPRDMALLQSPDGGNSWNRISTVGVFHWKFDGCPHIGGSLAESLSETIHSVVWTGLENKQGLYYLRSHDHGEHWTMPKLLSKQALHGDIAVAGQAVTAIWDEKGPEGLGVVGSNSNDDGRFWSPAVHLSKLGTIASHPKVMHTQAGIVAFWTEKAPKQPNQWVIMILED